MLALLAFAMALVGCEEITAGDVCAQYLSYIASGNYGAAYDMLHSSRLYADADYLSAEDKGESHPARRLTRQQFIDRYTNIFGVLGITNYTYTFTREVTGDAICVFDYDIYFESDIVEDLYFSYCVTLLREDRRWKVEWSPALIFPDMDWGDTVRTDSLQARRGEILADGMLLAETVNAVSVSANPAMITDLSQFARQVSALTDVSTERIIGQVENATGDFVIIKQYYPDQFSQTLESQLLLIEGISIDRSNFGTLRNYPQWDMLAHIIGYVGPATEEDLIALTGSVKGNSLYNSDSRVGKAGLEYMYEKQLRGSDGYFIYILGADGTNKGTLYREPASDGLDIQLTLDYEMQERADKLLKYSLYGDNTAGAVIVLNPTTGAIKAMSSYPSYDLNLFARGMNEAEWQALSSKANAPLFNRLTQGRYPPGSIFKPFTVAIALESGKMTPSTAFPTDKEEIYGIDGDDKLYWRPSDTGEFGPWNYAIITRVTLRNRHTPLNMHNGMIDSDNIYFAYAALRTGIDAFAGFTDRLGLNEAIPFDVSVHKAQVKNEESEWNPMLLAESAFGQGEILVTPLQAASLFGSLANKGSIMQPYLVKGLYRTRGIGYVEEETHTPTAWKENVISEDIIRTIEPMLEDVINIGTGRSLDMQNVAGKTGTAQVGDDRMREISWFVGYRLRTSDPLLVLVMLETPANNSAFTSTRFLIARTLLSMDDA
jgi:penicillin-binding protein